MQFGFYLPNHGPTARPEPLKSIAQLGDKLGYYCMVAGDHILVPKQIESPYPYTVGGEFHGAGSGEYFEQLTLLTYLAGVTENIRLVPSVMIVPYRPPLLAAKILATLDVLSQGRLTLGVGVGWMKEEFDAVGRPWDRRGSRADETLEVFEALFEEGLSTYHGTWTEFRDIGFSPKPVNNHIPVWVGGHSSAAFKRTAKFGDAFHSAFAHPDLLSRQWAAVETECEIAGRDFGELELTSLFRLNFEGGNLDEGEIGGGTEQVIDQVGRYAEVGLSHAAFFVLGRGNDGRLDAINRFAEEIAPHFSNQTEV